MAEKSCGEFITDEASAGAYLSDLQADAEELSARAQEIDLKAVLWPRDLERLRQEASDAVRSPEDFLRTRALLYSELDESDTQRQLGLKGYIEQSIDELLDGPRAS